jgi:hypothetical protein
MASRIHSVAPRLAIFAALPLVAIGLLAYIRFTRPYAIPAGSDIFAVVQGRWAWTTVPGGCDTSWHRITFTADHRVMTITSSKPYERSDGTLDSVAVYDISAHTDSWIRGAIRGETRLTRDGTPVVWDLVLRSQHRYAWHRTDWDRGGLTAAVDRCPEPS